ncbi:prepilin peptidase [Vibrio sp. E150_011]
MVFLTYLLLLLLFCCLVSFYDVKTRTISNKLLLILSLFQVYFIGLGNIHYDATLTVLIVGLVGFACGWIGAGDIKYAAVLSLAFPWSFLPQALIITGYSGGVLVCFYYAKHVLFCNGSLKEITLPYGLAISVGFYLTILTSQFQ